MKKNISFILFAYNEEKRIAYAIKNLINFGDVFVLDGGSTDSTRKISEDLGAVFVSRPENKQPFMETEENFEFIKKIIKTDWIYWGYVDNILPKTLLEKLGEISQQGKFKYVNIPIYTYLWGNTKHYAHKGYSPFFYHKDFITFKKNHIHGLGKFTGEPDQVLFLENKEDYAIKHFSTYTINKFIPGHLRYAETEAAQKFERGEKFSLFKMLGAMIRYMYIYGKYSYKNGVLGIIITLNYAFYRLLTYSKLYELEHSITIDSVEKNYSIAKENMLQEF